MEFDCCRSYMLIRIRCPTRRQSRWKWTWRGICERRGTPSRGDIDPRDGGKKLYPLLPSCEKMLSAGKGILPAVSGLPLRAPARFFSLDHRQSGLSAMPWRSADRDLHEPKEAPLSTRFC